MKREHRDLHLQDPFCGGGGGASSSGAGGPSSSPSGVYHPIPPPPEFHGKSKMWPEEDKDAGVDEFLALSGYMVKCSDMVEVAQKIEKLEQVIGQTQEDGLVSHLASETVHYNPADLSSWLESMASGMNPLPGFGASTSNSSICLPLPPPVDDAYQFRLFEDSSSDYDLKAIPGKAVFPSQSPPNQPNKRLKHSSSSYSHSITSTWGIQNESARPFVLVDSQENGIRLVHALMACAEAVQQENLNLAEVLVKQVGFLAVAQSGAMRKVATYFAEALARRIYRLFPENHSDSAFSDSLQMHFYETCPYLKFAHFTANQAILEAFSGKKRVHVIDFSLKQGMQWPVLMQALALQPGGPPSFRLTGIGPPSADGSDHLQEVGWKLAQMAEMIQVEFEFSRIVTKSLADLSPSMLNLREGEAVAINSVFELHPLLSRQGGIEKVLTAIREMNPEIVTVVEQEANHNGPVFLDRFTESLHYYSTLFDSLESCSSDGSLDAAAEAEAAAIRTQNKLMSEDYLGRQICNVVACEGEDRVERHETLSQWRDRFNSTGFEPVHLGSNAYKQASMLLALFNGDGYRVEENDGSLLLGWHTRPLIAASAWKIAKD